MDIMFLDDAWQDYLYWRRALKDTAMHKASTLVQKTDKKILALDSCSSTETAKTALSRKRINQLIKDTQNV